MFGPYDSQQCVSVTIINDEKLEINENFNVSLSIVNDLGGRVELHQAEAVATIYNDDGKVEITI